MRAKVNVVWGAFTPESNFDVEPRNTELRHTLAPFGGVASSFPPARPGATGVIVVEDNPERTFDLRGGVRHVSWKEIDADLGSDAWIVPRRTDAVRNYGFLLAAREKPDMIVTLDDEPGGPGRSPARSAPW